MYTSFIHTLHMQSTSTPAIRLSAGASRREHTPSPTSTFMKPGSHDPILFLVIRKGPGESGDNLTARLQGERQSHKSGAMMHTGAGEGEFRKGAYDDSWGEL
jgi:hypothetical protein